MYTFISDPGHAWLEVSEKEVKELGVIPSNCSYIDRRNHKLYLEEDVDAQTFIQAKGLNTSDIHEKHCNTYCFVRTLERAA
jgi:hypothetical protein